MDNIERLKSGTYIAAISGGIDSVVLLNMLSKQKNIKIIVAHVNHGIRGDSAQDEAFVKELAQEYRYEYTSTALHLDKGASENVARQGRYAFLYEQKVKFNADAIITAHHKDDLLETALINLLRGTGRKGLSSLQSGVDIIRPLLNFYKAEIADYAIKNHLYWAEDSTNYEYDYLRNRVRSKLERATSVRKRELLTLIHQVAKINTEIDEILTSLYKKNINRKDFIMYDYALSKEVLTHWLRTKNIGFDKPMIELLAIRFKTGRPGTKFIAKNGRIIYIEKDFCFTD